MNNLNNRVQLIGRLGIDPEVRTFSADSKMARLQIATSDRTKDKEGKLKEHTHWHNVVAWGNLAKITESYLKKGSKVAIEGRLNYRSFEDKDGNKRYVTEIVMNELIMLGGK